MNSHNPKELVFVKLLMPYLAGIVVIVLLPLQQLLWPIGATLVAISALLFIVHRNSKPVSKPSYSAQWAIVLYGWLAFAGMLNTQWANPTLSTHYYGHYVDEPGAILLSVEHKPVVKGLYYQTLAKVTAKKQGEKLYAMNGKVMLYLPIDSMAGTIKYGDILAVNTRPEVVPPPKNPYEFDYQQYLANKRIHYQLTSKADRWYATSKNDGHWFYKGLETVRENALAILQSHLPDTAHYGVASAMLLGHRDGISQEVLMRYSLTGAIHVLSVSGMHMTLIYGLLAFVLIPLKTAKKPWLRLVVILAIIWLYACLTELSPAVVRASIMFSLFAIGQTIYRKPNALNITAASALLILLFYPMQLLDVGFQLSYLAMVGILFLYGPISDWIPIKNKYLRLVWEGTALSIAAQAATLPLIMYYFHQMAIYTLPANLIVMLLAPVVMYAGVALLLLYWIPGLGWLIGKGLWAGLWLMDESLRYIAALPFAAWKALYPTLFQVLLLFGMVGGWMLSTQMRKVKPVMAIMAMLILYLASTSWQLHEQKQQQQLAVYHYNKQTALAILNGQAATLWLDCAARADTNKLERSIYPFLHANGMAATQTHLLDEPNNEYGMVGAHRFALLQNYRRSNIPAEKLKVDYLIITRNPSVNMEQIRWVYQAKYIIFDGSNNTKAVSRWMKECKVLGLDCQSTRDGAFIASW